MRNGGYVNNYFMIGISRLNGAEKERLIAVLQSKLCLESHITMGGRRLAIHNPELIVSKLRPYFHSSQLYRLERKAR